MFHAESLTLATKGRGSYEVTRQIQQIVADAGVERGSARSSSTTLARP